MRIGLRYLVPMFEKKWIAFAPHPRAGYQTSSPLIIGKPNKPNRLPSAWSALGSRLVNCPEQSSLESHHSITPSLLPYRCTKLH